MLFRLKQILLSLSLLAVSVYAQAQGSSFTVPSVVEAGSKITITGPFDGNAANTIIVINTTPVIVEKESHSSCSAIIPPLLSGNHKLVLFENGSRYETVVTVLEIIPSLSSSNLLKGETTMLTLTVRGAEDLEVPVNIFIDNLTPEQISIGEDVRVIDVRVIKEVKPGDEPVIKVKIQSKHTGDFNVTYQLSDEDVPPEEFAEAPDKKKEPADSTAAVVPCGWIKGKVTSNPPRKFKAIVVYVTGTCDLCHPAASVTFTFDSSGIHPPFAVIPKDSSFTIKNGYTKQIDELPTIVPSPFDSKRAYPVDKLAKGESTKVTPTREGEYLLHSDIHKFSDGIFFVTPNTCYSIADTAGNYIIGDLPPGTYTVTVFTHLKLFPFPEASVIVKAGETTTQDFLLERKKEGN